MAARNTAEDPQARTHLHGGLQRRVTYISIGLAILLAIVLIPLMTDPELRLDVFRSAGVVPSAEGELVADPESGATLIVLPTLHELETTGRPEERFLAAYITKPAADGMLLEPINEGDAFTIPVEEYDLVSSSPDGSEMYVRGDDAAVLVDVEANRAIEELPADEAPDVDWDWHTAVWETGVGRCDRISNTQRWIACFERPVLASYLAGDWHLSIHAYGGSDEVHDVARGLGFQPILGFSADDRWIYLYNERGIRRFSVEEAVEG